MKSGLEKQFLDEMAKNPSNWKGPFYFNRRDPRVLVPKMNPSMGWTLNFGSTVSFFALGAIFVILVLSIIF